MPQKSQQLPFPRTEVLVSDDIMVNAKTELTTVLG
jgi:hypothetical protein